MITTVNTTAGLIAALRSANGGDTILLASGTYNAVALNGLNFSSSVTIQSADPAHEAVINNLNVSGSSGLVFQNLDIATSGGGTAANITSSHGLVFSNDVFSGEAAGSGNAMMIRGSENVTITGSDFHNFWSGINELTDDNLTVSNNSFEGITGGAIRGTGVTNEVISGNAFLDAKASVANHQDVVYLWQDNVANHVTISSNNTYGATSSSSLTTTPVTTTPVTTAAVTTTPTTTTTTPATTTTTDTHTVTVTSTDGLLSALKNAHSGDVIKLAAGTYNSVVLNNLHFDGAVTIESATSSQAVINGLIVSNSSGLDIQNLNVEVTGSGYAVNLTNSSNIEVTGLTIHGANSDLEGLGVNLRNDTNVTVSNSEITHLGSGIGFQGNTNVTISGNNFHDIATDGVVGGSTNVVVTGNTFTDFHPAAGAHPDAIQFFAAGGVESSDVLISNNVVTRGSGDPIQGIFIENTNHIEITGNAMAGTLYNGISVSGVSQALISNNFVDGFTDMDSRIITRGASSDVTVEGNTSEDILNYQPNGVLNPNYVETGNTAVSATAVGDLSAMKAWLAQHASAASVTSFSSPGWVF